VANVSMFTVLVSITVCVPDTVKLPLMTTFFPTFRFEANVTLSGKPIVTVPELSETVVSFAVPAKVIVPPNAVAVELEPSVTVIELLANCVFGIALVSISPVEEL